MRIKCSCTHCATHIEFEATDAGKSIACPNCKRITTLNFASMEKVPKIDEYIIRWRGREEGPLPVSEIEERLNAGKIGLLTEVGYGSAWITLREFLKEVKAAKTQGLESSAEQPTCPSPLETFAAQSAESRQAVVSPGHKKVAAIAIALVVTVLVFASVVYGIHSARRAKPIISASVPAGAGHSAIPFQPQPVPTNSALHLAVVPTISSISVSNDASGVSPTTLNTPVATGNATNEKPGGGQVSQLGSNTPGNAVAIEQTNAQSINTSLGERGVAVEPPAIAAFPENEIRTFKLETGGRLVGTIIHVNDQGLVFNTNGHFTLRIPWNALDPATLEREPKVIAFQRAKEEKRLAQERARIAAEQAVAAARAEEEARAARIAAYRSKQDGLLDKSIALYGTQVVKRGYLKAWGTTVTIGEIFDVVAPSAKWTADKLADHEPERYTDYLVEARWVNKEGEHVAMQYLVTADGSDFRLHGCFVSGSKMPDMPFLLAVKSLWDQSKR